MRAYHHRVPGENSPLRGRIHLRGLSLPNFNPLAVRRRTIHFASRHSLDYNSALRFNQDTSERRHRDVDFSNLESARSVACHVSCWGFIEWAENLDRPNFRGIREYSVAFGLGAAAIPSLVFVGLFSLMLGLSGKGKGRSILLVGAGFLVLVWSMAFSTLVRKFAGQ